MMASVHVVTALALTLAAAHTSAHSPDPATPAGPSITANLSVATQYISRGVRQTWGRPALQAGVDLVFPNGWSAGTWASNVDDRFVEKATLEWDLYGGYTHAIGEGSVAAILYYYAYPGAVITSTGTKFHYGELSLAANYKSLYAKANVTYTRDFFGITNARGTVYWDVGANHPLSDDWTLNLHAGLARVSGTGNAFWDWSDWKVGVTKVLAPGWSAALAYTRAHGKTDAYSRYISAVNDSSGKPLVSNAEAGAFVLALTRTF
jgi:uncharacterized protein (TIGR02001 family)